VENLNLKKVLIKDHNRDLLQGVLVRHIHAYQMYCGDVLNHLTYVSFISDQLAVTGSEIHFFHPSADYSE